MRCQQLNCLSHTAVNKTVSLRERMTIILDLNCCYCYCQGQNSAVRNMTHYTVDGPGFKSCWGKELFSSPYLSRPVLRHPPASTSISTGAFSQGHGIDHSPHLAPRIGMSGAIPLLSLCALLACYGETLAFTLMLSLLLPMMIKGMFL